MKKKTHIAVVVDRSGSMSPLRKAALDGLNEVLSQLERDGSLGGDTDVSVILFDDVVEPVLEGVLSDMIPEFTEEDYVPQGTTALYDALKQAIESISDSKENDDTAYLVTVISDGMENASKTTQEEISAMIKELEAQGNWTFTFMLANQDVHDFTMCMGVSAGNVATFTSTLTGTADASRRMAFAGASYLANRSVGNLRTDVSYTQ